jgi:hypothetical protein
MRWDIPDEPRSPTTIGVFPEDGIGVREKYIDQLTLSGRDRHSRGGTSNMNLVASL